MHTDYKVGILIGVVVLAVGGAYMLLRSPEEVITEPPVVQEEPIVTLGPDDGLTEIDLTEDPDEGTPGSDALIVVEPDVLVIDDGGEMGDDVIVVGPTVDDTLDGGTVTPGTADTADLVVGTGDEGIVPEEDDTVVVMDGGVDTPGDTANVGTISNEEDLTVVVDIGVITPVGNAAQSRSTYRVQKGDDGYWAVAEKVWGEGNGRHWKKIQNANPGVDSTSLAPGMMLRIPLLEDATATTAGGTTVAASGAPKPGDTFINSAGQKVYVVSKGDSAGLWGVSSKMYGKGHLWRTIAKANPTAKPTQLKAGQHLVIPPNPSTSSTTPTAPTPVSPGGSLTVGGVDYYVVTKEDSSGLWGIAEKIYGNGKYYTLLQKANPNVNSNALRAGQRLVKPAKPTK